MTKPIPKKVLVTARTMSRVLSAFVPVLERAGWIVDCETPAGQRFAAEDLAGLAEGCHAMIVGDDELSPDFFARAPETLGLVVKWGVGTDSIDYLAAEAAGVRVFNTPRMFGAEVADLAMGYVLSLARNIVAVHSAVQAGVWPQPEGITLAGRTLGIVGFGDAGQSLARRAAAFGMDVIFSDPYFPANPEDDRRREVAELFGEADFVVMTCPSTSETRGMVAQASLSLMKHGSFLVNVARGDLVVEEDLCDALASGQLAGAALDVFGEEPLPMSSPLRDQSSVIFGAHNGSNTRAGLLRASERATEIVIDWGGGMGL